MLAMIKCMHVLCGLAFFGITLAAFFYISRSIKSHDRAAIAGALKASYYGDALIFCCIVSQSASSVALVSANHLSVKVPWIFVAYHAFGLVVLLWLGTLLLKLCYLAKERIAAGALKTFYALHIGLIMVFMLIIRDAVTQSTGLEFLLRS